MPGVLGFLIVWLHRMDRESGGRAAHPVMYWTGRIIASAFIAVCALGIAWDGRLLGAVPFGVVWVGLTVLAAVADVPGNLLELTQKAALILWRVLRAAVGGLIGYEGATGEQKGPTPKAPPPPKAPPATEEQPDVRPEILSLLPLDTILMSLRDYSMPVSTRALLEAELRRRGYEWRPPAQVQVQTKLVFNMLIVG